MNNIVYGLYLLGEIGLKLCVSPRLRARLLRMLGASIGSNVRVYSCTFINPRNGFRALHLDDDVHVGAGCLIDLEARIRIGKGTTVSPRVVLLSHSDPGSSHDSPLAAIYTPTARGVTIGSHCWIGASTTILDGSKIGDQVVVAAGSLVRGVLEDHFVYAGIPARKIKPVNQLAD